MKSTFICFVSRDKELAEQLIAPMKESGMAVHPIKLQLGDRPVEKIKEGFSHAESGALLLSPAFFKNPWPRSDLDELAAMARPNDGLSIIWADIDANTIAGYSPELAHITGYPAEMMTVDQTAPSMMQQMPSDPLSKGISFEQLTGQTSVNSQIQFVNANIKSPMRDIGVIDLPVLSKMIVSYFSISELRSLAFDLGIDYDDLAGEGISGKARELVLYMKRSGQLEALVNYVSEARPFVDWQSDSRSLK